MGFALNLYIASGSMVILTTLILPFQELMHGIFFYLFVSSSISFINILSFSVCRSLTSLVKFILRYFILFDAIVNGIVFLIFHSDSLLAYRNTADFCILIWYSATLLHLF